MNQDLLSLALDQVKLASKDRFHFPESLYRHIAFRMVKENQMDQEKWLSDELEQTRQYVEHKRDLAAKGGFAPFTFMGKSAFFWIQKNCAQWVLKTMETSFRDPEDIHPDWAVQCAKTMSVIGKEEIEAQGENLYTFVTRHPEWHIQGQARDDYHRTVERAKKRFEQRNPDRRRQYQEHRQRVQSQPLLVPCQMEAVVKFDSLPKPQRASEPDLTFFELGYDGRVIGVEVKRHFFEKLSHMNEPWTAVLSGNLSEDSAGGLFLAQPFCRVYPKKSGDSIQ